jgi:hypothetical protein
MSKFSPPRAEDVKDTRHQLKKPAAGGGAAGFLKEPNSDWEEECRCSYKQPWEEEWAA